MTVCWNKKAFLRICRIGIQSTPLILFAYSSASAQSTGVPAISAPESVCTSENFDVEWSGPGATGDRIALTVPAAPADDTSISAPTSAGNPVSLNAPDRAGIYEVRYAEGARRNILARQGVRVVACLTESSQTGAGSSQSGSDASTSGSSGANGSGGTLVGSGGDRAVMVWGFQSDKNYQVPDVGADAGPLGFYTSADLCNASDEIGWALETIVNTGELAAIESGFPITLGGVESIPGAPQREDIKEALRTARDGFCDREEEPVSTYPFTITYAHCRMTMTTNVQVLDIQLVPGTMAMADLVRGEGAQLSLRQQLGQAEAVLGSGWSSDIDMTSLGDGGDWIGYPTTMYEFDYSGGPGTGIPGPLERAIKVENYGLVWVSEDVPGIGIVRDFYQNLTNEVSRQDGSFSFFEGLINSLVGMLEAGMPLMSVQATDASVVNRFRGNAEDVRMEGDSAMIVTNVKLIDTGPDWCTRPYIPSNITLTDVDQQVSEALSQMNSPEMQQAMQEYEQAMQQMTPEQRQMMEQMGVGSMLDQMMGGSMPGAQPPAANPRASSGSAGSNMPPADELNSGNLTESVQRHLEALGYDVGDANGEMSMSTTIAISTFQAEKGMEVTGEVSPQLLGILSAEVDSRR